MATTGDHAGLTDAASPFDGAKVALFVGDRLLIIRRDDRPDIPWPDHWDFPGGGREGAETPLQTACRETAEEVGLHLQPHHIIWQRRFLRDDGRAVWFLVARLPAACASRIVLGDEGQGWQLASVPDVLAMEHVAGALQERLALWLADKAACNATPVAPSA